MAYTYANSPQVPGKFRLQEGKRSVARDEPGTNYQALTFSDTPSVINANRAVALRACVAVHGANKSTACPSKANCQCDEFPMARTLEGVASVEDQPAKFSVRVIDGSDNGSAGFYFRQMLTRERIYKSGVDKFWIYMGNAPTTPHPPPPPPVAVTSQLEITSTETDLENGKIFVNYRLTNKGPTDLVGPFRLYYPGLDSRVHLDPTWRSLEGKRCVDIGHGSIGSQISVGAGVTVTVPAGVPLNMKYALLAGHGTGSVSWDAWDPRIPPTVGEV